MERLVDCINSILRVYTFTLKVGACCDVLLFGCVLSVDVPFYIFFVQNNLANRTFSF